MEKDWRKKPSDRQLQKARKKTETAVSPIAEAVLIPAQMAPPGFLQAKHLRHLHAQLSGAEMPQAKESRFYCHYEI